ncbi:MAG: AI-2E family transporter [Alphaproteobacteria bacterium]|nr:AI-2E family transporter [Alphaproteobacteria bacterium]
MITPGQLWREWGGWLIAALLAVLLYRLSGMLAPFVLSLILAYLLNPLVERMEAWGIARPLGCVLGLVLVVGMVAGLLLLLLPLLQLQISALLSQLPEYWSRVQGMLSPLSKQLGRALPPEVFAKLQAGAQAQAAEALSYAGQVASGLAGKLLSGGLALLNVLSLLVITPVVAFYLLRDWPLLLTHVNRLLPSVQAPAIRQLMQEVDNTLAGFLRGQSSVCLALSLYYMVALSLGGLQSSLVVGLLTGVLAFMPYVGALSGGFFALSLAWMQSGDWHLPALMLAIFVVGQLLEGYVLTPKLVGGRVGLHPVWIIFALMAGGALAGFVGVLVAVPVAAVIGVTIRYLLARRQADNMAEAAAAQGVSHPLSQPVSRRPRRPIAP